MHVVMIAKQKGGVGASTLVRELGVAAAAAGKRVVLIDLDGQGTTRSWWNRRTASLASDADPNPGLALPTPAALPDALAELRRTKVELVIIDTPPSVHAFMGTVMQLADLILLPTRPTTDDLTALPPVLEQAEVAGKPFMFVVSQSPPGRSRLYDDALPILAERGRVAPPLRLRTDFPISAAEGSTTTEMAPGSKAAAEVMALWLFLNAELKRAAKKAKTVA